MPHVEGAGVALHYRSRGEGPAVVVVHGMASDAEAWAPVLDELAAAGARAIAFDRRGYGASGAPEPYAATTVQEQSEDAGALLDALVGAPAVLVGDGFGALVVLELLVRRPELARAAVLVDPPLHAFVAGRDGGARRRAGAAGGGPARGRAGRGGAGVAGRRRRWPATRRAPSGRPPPSSGSSPTTPASRAGRRRAASCARSACRSRWSRARARRRTSWRRRMRSAALLADARRASDGDVVAAVRALL